MFFDFIFYRFAEKQLHFQFQIRHRKHDNADKHQNDDPGRLTQQRQKKQQQQLQQLQRQRNKLKVLFQKLTYFIYDYFLVMTLI